MLGVEKGGGESWMIAVCFTFITTKGVTQIYIQSCGLTEMYFIRGRCMCKYSDRVSTFFETCVFSLWAIDHIQPISAGSVVFLILWFWNVHAKHLIDVDHAHNLSSSAATWTLA